MVHIETIYEGCDSVHKIPLKKKPAPQGAGARPAPAEARWLNRIYVQ